MRIAVRLILYFHEGVSFLSYILKYFDCKQNNYKKFLSLEIIELFFNEIELLILLYISIIRLLMKN